MRAMVYSKNPPLSPARPPFARRRLRRQLAVLLCVAAFIWTVPYRHYAWVQSTHIPIMGHNPSEFHGYFPPIGDSFSPEVPSYNVYKRTHPRTPLLIPFTRNNTMLRQAVLSYIASGWPRNDIVIVDNTGTMDSNERRVLKSDNPFFLDYDLFRRQYGVAILQTPVLLNFAQLQNFFLRTAIAREWPFFFWSHMDIAVLSGEDIKPYKSFYHRVIDVLDASGADQYLTLPPTGQELGQELNNRPHSGYGVHGRYEKVLSPVKRRLFGKSHKKLSWAIKFFDFDNLSLINVAAWREIGNWDSFIPYYNTDCDAYARLLMHGYTKDEVAAGYIFDVADVVEDAEIRFFPANNEKGRKKWGLAPDGPERAGGEVNSLRFQWLKAELQEMMDTKTYNVLGRNTWQGAALENKKKRKPIEPWAYDPKAFQAAWWASADYGRAMYIKKWGTLECDLMASNKTVKDAWALEYLEEQSDEWKQRVWDEVQWNEVLAENSIR